MQTEAGTEGLCHSPGTPGPPREPGTAGGSPALEPCPALPTSRLAFPTSSAESMAFCCVQPPSLWYLVTGSCRTLTQWVWLGSGLWGGGQVGAPASSMPGVWSCEVPFPENDRCPHRAQPPTPAHGGDGGGSETPLWLAGTGGWAGTDGGSFCNSVRCWGAVRISTRTGSRALSTPALPSGERRWLHSAASQTIKACLFGKCHH